MTSLLNFIRQRPWLGALCTALGGGVILNFAGQSMLITLTSSTSGSGGVVLGVGLLLCATVAFFLPRNAVVMGLFAIFLGLAAFIVTNLGGMVIGSVLSVIGGSLLAAWGPVDERAKRGLKLRRKNTEVPA